MQPHVHCSITYNSQDMKTKCPLMDKWIENKSHTHTHTHTKWNISHKKNEILPFATPWMNLKGIISEISQTKKDKY